MIEITIPKDYETDNLSSLSVLQETSLEKDNKKIHISFYNFKRELPSDEPLDKYSFSVFLINEFDRAEMHPMEASCSKYQYSSLFPSSKYEIHLTESYSEKIYNHCVARACLDGYVQRECIVCHYYWRDERDHFWPHKCGLRKMIHGQTYALRCNNFRYCEMKALELLNEKTE
ncbi:MAG: hypothetical protein K6E96_05820 [Bacteroidales bacterium]|nr:hypothetical protein [Bacteroidales bacterium]